MNADEQNKGLFLHFEKPTPKTAKKDMLNIDLNKAMVNAGGETFDYGTFTAAYETDPRVKTMVKNFSKDGVEVKTKNNVQDPGPEDSAVAADTGQSDVTQMAQQAVDIS